MSENTNINLHVIAEECGIFNTDYSESIIEKIDAIKEKYNENDLVNIYNYLLKKAQNPDVIMYLIRLCDSYRNQSSLEFLVDILLLKNGDSSALKEKYMNARIMAAKAIGNLKNTCAVSSLLYCLNNKDENYRVRLACADALGRIGDRYAVAPLIEVVSDEEEKSVYLREGAALALGVLGDKRAIEPLVNILETKQGIMDKFSFLKERIIESINKMGFGENERVFKALKASLSDESVQVRIEAIEAIMNSENPKAFDTIKNCMMNDEDEEVKKNALIALYNMSDRSVLDEVISSSSYSDKLKMAAVEILDEYENDEDEIDE